MTKPKIYSTNEVAEKFDVSVASVLGWCKAGKLPGAKLVEYPRGAVWEIPAASVENFKAPKRGRKPDPHPSDFALAKRRQRERDANPKTKNTKENQAA